MQAIKSRVGRFLQSLGSAFQIVTIGPIRRASCRLALPPIPHPRRGPMANIPDLIDDAECYLANSIRRRTDPRRASLATALYELSPSTTEKDRMLRATACGPRSADSGDRAGSKAWSKAKAASQALGKDLTRRSAAKLR